MRCLPYKKSVSAFVERDSLRSMPMAQRRSDRPGRNTAMALFVAAVLCFLALDPAQGQAAKRAGAYWASLSREQKTDLVLGIFDGFNLNENILGITLKNEYSICSEIMDSIMRQSDAYFADMPAGRIVSGLDAFYAERKNRNIPISWGVWVVVRKNRRDATLPQFLEELRNLYP